MGWIRGLNKPNLIVRSVEDNTTLCGIRNGTANAEIGNHPNQEDRARSQDASKGGSRDPDQLGDVPDEQLPLILREEVESKRRPGALAGTTTPADARKDYWIVVDGIVYDCTHFISEHPGGEQVILSFVGEDCSWQFWRFHGKTEMAQYGRKLRIGRTEGVTNRFKEPTRFVGLSKFGNDEW